MRVMQPRRSGANVGGATATSSKGEQMAAVAQDTHDALKGVSAGDLGIIESAVGLREAHQEATGLDARTFSLVKIAALIALDAPPASYAWQVPNALAEGATPEDLLGVLRAVAPQVGGPRVVAAAPELMLAMGLALDEG
jgi:4-carboxymuconolactone decarboxylase